MSPSVVRRVLFAAIPALLLVLVGLSTVFSSHGLLRHQALRAELDAATEELAAIERDNAALILQIGTMERDPLVIERVVADELGFARPGTTLYRFDLDDEPADDE